jgi:hypothetical protein
LDQSVWPVAPTQPVSGTCALFETLSSKQERFMGLANYRIFGTRGAWRIDHDGKAENVYATKEQHLNQQ